MHMPRHIRRSREAREHGGRGRCIRHQCGLQQLEEAGLDFPALRLVYGVRGALFLGVSTRCAAMDERWQWP